MSAAERMTALTTECKVHDVFKNVQLVNRQISSTLGHYRQVKCS